MSFSSRRQNLLKPGVRVAVLIFLLGVGPLGYAQGSSPPVAGESNAVQVLELNQPVEKELGVDETHVYRVMLQPAQFMRVFVNLYRISIVVRISDPEGRPIFEAASGNRPAATGRFSVLAATAGWYQVSFRPAQGNTQKGSYKVILINLQTLDLPEILSLAAKLRATREYDDAVKMLEAALKLFPASGEQAELKKALRDTHFAWGERAYYSLNDYSGAIEHLNSAERIGPTDTEYRGRVWLLLRQLHTVRGIQFRQEQKYTEATKDFNEAVLLARWLGDKDKQLELLGWLYDIASFLGENRKAIEYANDYLEVAEGIGNPIIFVKGLNDLANSLRAGGYWGKALHTYEDALAQSKQLKIPALRAGMLINLGMLYARFGDQDKAIKVFNEAYSLSHKKNGYGLLEEGALYGLGYSYHLLGNYDKAISYLEQAVVISQKLKSQLEELKRQVRANPSLAIDIDGVSLLINSFPNTDEIDISRALGMLYNSKGNYDKASQYFEKALALSREAKSRPDEARALIGLGMVNRARRKPAEALKNLKQALAISQEQDLEEDKADLFSQLMRTWSDMQQPRTAILFGKEAINIYQSIRGSSQQVDKSLQESFVASKEDIYRELADLLISEQRIVEAQQVIDLLKKQEYLDYITRQPDEPPPTGAQVSLTEEETKTEELLKTVGAGVTAIGREYGELLNKKERTQADEAKLAELFQRLTLANQQFQDFLDALPGQFQTAEVGQLVLRQVQGTQGLMVTLHELGSKTVAIHTLLLKDKYVAIVTTDNVQTEREFRITPAELSRKVSAFRAKLQDPNSNPLAEAKDLYNILVGPIAGDLEGARAETLMWSLDGVLRYVPIAALHDGEKYLVARYRNVIFTPASDSRLKDDPAANWRVAGFGVWKSPAGSVLLPAVQEELRGIIREDGNTNTPSGLLPGIVFLDGSFTEAALISSLQQRRYPVIHIASHFKLLPGKQKNSYLLLGDGSQLTIERLTQMPTIFSGVDLLTLSACNTATGDGKEVEGLGVRAQDRGAKAVLASLWAVADSSTSKLMQEFYRLHKDNTGMTKAEALQAAQKALLLGQVRGSNGKPYTHPYYWAPFILIGNWK